MKDKEYLRPDEIAQILSISKRKVYLLINDVENPLPASKIDGQYRVKTSDFHEFMEKNKHKPWV